VVVQKYLWFLWQQASGSALICFLERICLEWQNLDIYMIIKMLISFLSTYLSIHLSIYKHVCGPLHTPPSSCHYYSIIGDFSYQAPKFSSSFDTNAMMVDYTLSFSLDQLNENLNILAIYYLF